MTEKKQRSEGELRTLSTIFKHLRWTLPIVIIALAIFIFPKYVPDIPLVFQLIVVGIGLSEFFVFNKFYQQTKDELKDRFGVRL